MFVLRNSLLRAGWLIGIAFSLTGRQVALAARPNVVLVMTDDHGYGDLGVHGNPHIRTPNLDRFAREGVQFSRFYVSSYCAPTRASLMTGRDHYRTGVLNVDRGGSKMHRDEVTVAEHLRAAGYRTAIFGKWHLGDNYPMRPSDQGFDESLIYKGRDYQGRNEGRKNFDPVLWKNDQSTTVRGYSTDIFFTAAIDFIEANRGRGFFVYLPTNAPHTPLDIAPQYMEPYLRMGLDETTARIYGMVEKIDENFGWLLAALERLGLRKDTLIVFLTDNGPRGFSVQKKPRYNAGMRGLKGTTYEGGIHVPGFIQWPGGFPGGRTIDRIAAHIDVLPTILDACGIAPPSSRQLDGKSLIPLLSGKIAPEQWPERTLFFQCHAGLEPEMYRVFSAVGQRFKLVGNPAAYARRNADLPDRAPVFELYDLASDPGEKNEVSAGHPEILGRLRQQYEAWFTSVRDTRNFQTGVIHVGSGAAPQTYLSRADSGNLAITTGWRVRVVRGGSYAVTFAGARGLGASRLAVDCAGKISRQALRSGEDVAVFELAASDGMLDVWPENAEGNRIKYTESADIGDVVIRRVEG